MVGVFAFPTVSFASTVVPMSLSDWSIRKGNTRIEASASMGAGDTTSPYRLGVNLPDASYSASSYNTGREPKFAFDNQGINNTAWVVANGSGTNNYLQVDLGSVMDFAETQFICVNNRILSYTITYSNDATNWCTAAAGSILGTSYDPNVLGNDKGGYMRFTDYFMPVSARYVRLNTVSDGINSPIVYEFALLPMSITRNLTSSPNNKSNELTSYPQLAKSKTYSKSSEASGFPVSNVFNGSFADGSVWRPDTSDTDKWVQVDFGNGTPATFNSVEVAFYGTQVDKYELLVSDDESSWTKVGNGVIRSGYSYSGPTGIINMFKSVTKRYLRVHFLGAVNNVYEVYVQNVPYNAGFINNALTLDLPRARYPLSLLGDTDRLAFESGVIPNILTYDSMDINYQTMAAANQTFNIYYKDCNGVTMKDSSDHEIYTSVSVASDGSAHSYHVDFSTVTDGSNFSKDKVSRLDIVAVTGDTSSQSGAFKAQINSINMNLDTNLNSFTLKDSGGSTTTLGNAKTVGNVYLNGTIKSVPSNYILIFAVYNENRQLIKLVDKNIGFNTLGNVQVNELIDLTDLPVDSNQTAKLMLWDSYENMIPIVDFKTLN